MIYFRQLPLESRVAPDFARRGRSMLKQAMLSGLISVTVALAIAAPASPVWARGWTAPDAGGSTVPVHKSLRITPSCFVAGTQSWAHIVLNHVGPHDAVEFIWAKPGVLSLGPGLGPGVRRANAVGIIRFAALSPARYGSAQVGRWQLVAEWPRAAHPFIKTRFRVVNPRAACNS
jgi:hypothetical protein